MGKSDEQNAAHNPLCRLLGLCPGLLRGSTIKCLWLNETWASPSAERGNSKRSCFSSVHTCRREGCRQERTSQRFPENDKGRSDFPWFHDHGRGARRPWPRLLCPRSRVEGPRRSSRLSGTPGHLC